jgi:iron complex outermembrane receptor protein
VYFEYRHSDPLPQSLYDFSACSIASSATGFHCQGSSTSFPGRFTNLNPPGGRFTIADAAGNVRPFIGSGTAVPNDLYNYGPINYYQVPDERYLANFFAHYDAFPNVRVYTEFDYLHSSTVLQIAPSGLFSQEFLLNDNNPLLSQSFKTAFGITPTTPGDMLIGRRNVEGGGRQDVPVHNDFRVVIGAKGDVLDGKWDYDAFWQSAKNDYSDTYLHDVSFTRAQRALNVVVGPNGQPTCQSVIDGSDPLCVPYNIFQLGGVTQAALDYIQVPGLRNSEITQSVVGLHVDSDLGNAYGWKLPWANTGIGVAGGFEHRTEKLNFQVDNEFATGDLTGQGGPSLPVSGQYTVNEAFGEVRVPVAENQPYAKNLAFNASYRWSNYNTGHTTNTYGLGAEWAPVTQARLRGTYQRAVRAANIVELFLPQGLNLFTLQQDPCGEGPTATVAQCALTGLPANLYGSANLTNPAGQYNYIQGGNPTLNPEKSDSYTLGVVLQPLPKLSATVDYFDIKVKDVIGPIPPSLAVQQCISAGQFCGLIHRDPRTGSLWFGNGFVTGTNVNLGSLKTTGIDVTANYNWDLDKWGGLAFALTGTWLHEFIVEPVPGLGTYNCAGFYGNTCGAATSGPAPKWRHVFTTTWNTPWSWLAGARWRFFDSVKIDTSSSESLLAGSFNPKDQELGRRNYFDIFAQWDINKNFTVRGGVNNLFDRDPPITSQGNLPYYNGNTFPQTYDIGRNIFINVNAKF